LAKSRAVETVKATHSLINGALEKAEEIRLVAKNVARGARIPVDDAGERETKALTKEEYARFMDDLAKRSGYYMFALFMSNTGLRSGEAIALTRKDVDLKNGTVRVNKTYVQATGGIQNSTKTASSNRTIPIPEATVRLLKEHMLRQKRQEPSAPLFQSETGGYLCSRNLRRQFQACGKRVGVDWLTIHTLRHTYASRLFQKKVDIKVISQLLGHKDVYRSIYTPSNSIRFNIKIY
jgi:integrase